jgi:hypothetical protein
MASVTPALTYKSVPMPSVEVYVSGLGSGTPTAISVYRIADGETSLVRGGFKTAASGAFTITDFEAPFGVPVAYYTETFNASGVSQGLSAQATITLSVNQVWMHDPVDLSNAMAVDVSGQGSIVLGAESFSTIKRGYQYNRSNVIGKRKPVVQFYGEKAIDGLEFTLITDNAGVSEVEDILSTSPVCVRTPAVFTNLPRLLYGVLEATQTPLNWHNASDSAKLTSWAMSFNETEAQSLAVVINFYTYTYWQSRYATYTLANTAYGSGSYINAVRNPPA